MHIKYNIPLATPYWALCTSKRDILSNPYNNPESYPHFIDEEAKAQRGKPFTHRWLASGQGQSCMFFPISYLFLGLLWGLNLLCFVKILMTQNQTQWRPFLPIEFGPPCSPVRIIIDLWIHENNFFYAPIIACHLPSGYYNNALRIGFLT